MKYFILLILFLTSSFYKSDGGGYLYGSVLKETVTRTITIKILLVEFQDVKHRSPDYPSNLSLPAYTYDDFYNLFFSTNEYFSPNMYSPDGEEVFGSISDYYRMMSDNNLIIDGCVLNKDLNLDNVPDWITLDHSKSYYDNDRGIEFIEEAKYKAKMLGLDLLKDENNFLSIIYAGHTYRSFINTLNPAAFYDNHEYIMGERFAAFAPYREERDDPLIHKTAAFSHIGIHVHEIGHLLGLDDLGGGFDNGYWCLMSKGAFNGPNQGGASPAPLNPYFRWLLGWTTFDRINKSSTKKLKYDLTNPEVYQLQDDNSDSFFLIEYRQLNSKMRIGELEIFDYNHYIKGCSSACGLLVWRKLNGHFVKLIHSSGEKSCEGNGQLYPGNCDIRVLSPWSDNRPPKMGDYWVPNTKPTLNCGFEVINCSYDNIILDLYQDFPETASPAKPKNLSVIPNRNVEFQWSENKEPDFDYYKIYKMKGRGKYDYYDISDTNYYLDQFEKTFAYAETKTYAYYKIAAIDHQRKKSVFSKEIKVAVLNNQTTSAKNSNEAIQKFTLFQNYPNPFNPSTAIKYTIPQSSVILSGAKNLKDFSSQSSPNNGAPQNDYVNVALQVYDILGREVVILVNQKQKPGNYEVTWNASNQPSGVYFYRLTAGTPSASFGQVFTDTKKLILMK